MIMVDRVGFEPTTRFPVYSLSRGAQYLYISIAYAENPHFTPHFFYLSFPGRVPLTASPRFLLTVLMSMIHC